MRCPACKTELPDASKFCKECGEKLEVTCPVCSKTIPRDSKFCLECGHDLRKPKESPAIDYQQPRSYTPKFLAEKILTSRSAVEGERKLVTVLFADVAGFTAMSETLDPEDVHEIMDGCFRILMDEIHRFEGTVNEFRGDGLMALFGAPVAHEDHAQRACHAALAIQQALIPYGERLQRRHGADFKMRIGLNSGPVVVGAIGDDLRMDYTAQGDTANLAARMESAAKPGGVLVSKNTYRLAREFFEFEPVGEIHVKGKEEPVAAYRLIRPTEVETRIEASAAKGLTRFVGRKRETETLKDAFDKARSGEGQVVGVVGEAGVGKSRLLLEFRNALPKGEYLYLEGRCLHYGSSIPYLPILDSFRTYLGIKDGEKESVVKQKMMERIVGSDENLTKCLPPIQEIFSIKVDDEEFTKQEPKEKRERTFEAIRDILIRGSQTRPIVMAIEDLHWIDKTTEEFLDYMIGWLPGSRILLILLYRPEYTHQWGSKSYYSKVGVGQLSSNTSAELVQAILEGGAVAPELRELILTRAAGNPLFMEELTHSLLENGSVQKEEDQYILVRNASEIQVPDTVQGIIAARMDRLEESLKRIMQVASVIGREFAFRILQAITDLREDLKSNLLNLQGLEFIYEKSLFPELEYIFRHALTQEVAYNSLLLKRRKEIHEKIGKAIETLYPTRLEEFCEMLAYHYSKSGNLAKGCEYLKASAEKAVRSDATFEAVQFYKEALQVLQQQPETSEKKKEHVELVLSMQVPVRRLGWSTIDFLPILQEAETVAQELGDDKKRMCLRSHLGVYYLYKGGNPELGWDYIESCLGNLEEIQDIELMIPIGFNLCESCVVSGDYHRMNHVGSVVINLIEASGNQTEFFGLQWNPYSHILALRGISTAMCGDFRHGERLLQQALSSALELDHPATLGRVDLVYGCMLAMKGEGQRAAAHFQDAIRNMEKSQTVHFLGAAWAWLGWCHSLMGQPRTAVDLAEKGLKMHTDLGMPFWKSVCHWICSYAHSEHGDMEEARSHAELALKFSLENNERHCQAQAKFRLGEIIVKIEPSKIEAAEQHILEGMSRTYELKLPSLSSLGHLHLGKIYRESGRREEALENLKKAESMFQEMGMDYWLAKAREVLARL